MIKQTKHEYNLRFRINQFYQRYRRLQNKKYRKSNEQKHPSITIKRSKSKYNDREIPATPEDLDNNEVKK